jgi:hypothetical protein
MKPTVEALVDIGDRTSIGIAAWTIIYNTTAVDILL